MTDADLLMWRWSTLVQLVRGVELVGVMQHSLIGVILVGLAAMLASSRADSVGMSELLPGGQPEVALQTADENMYKAKHGDRR